MRAVLMAGGSGTRLRPLTCDLPKPMVPILNRPIAEHIINLLKRHQITEVIATLHYLPDVLRDYFQDGSDFGVQMTYAVEEDQPLGTAGCVKNIAELLDETFLVISGDSITDFDLTAAIAFHKEKRAKATLILTRVPNPMEFGVVITDEQGSISRFLEKPSTSEIFSDTVNTGIYILEPDVLDYLPSNCESDFSKDLFPLMLERGESLYGYIAQGYWCDVGHLDAYREAQYHALQRKVNLDFAYQEVSPNLWVGQNTFISPTAIIETPVMIGENCRIGARVQIEAGTIIGDNVTIGADANLKRPILWNGSIIGEEAHLSGCVISRGTRVDRRAHVLEAAVVGSLSTIGEEAQVSPNVRVWPSKKIESGAVLNINLIWGNTAQRNLFGQRGVQGLANIDITPEFAVKLGAAYGSTLKPRCKVTVSRDQRNISRMVTRSLIAGLMSVGVDIQNLDATAIPIARTVIPTMSVTGGIHVRVHPDRPDYILIEFMDNKGINITKAQEKKVEGAYFKEDMRRSQIHEVGDVSYPSQVIERYCTAFEKLLNVDTLRNSRAKVVIDYVYAVSGAVLPLMLDKFGADAVVLNASVNKSAMSVTDRETLLTQLGHVVEALKANFGVQVSANGEQLILVDESGFPIRGEILTALMVDMILTSNPRGTVVVPVHASSAVEQVARRHDGRVIRTKANPTALMEACQKNPNVVLGGSGDTGFIFPHLHPGFDSMFCIAKLIEMLTIQERSLATARSELPRVVHKSYTVRCPWTAKGALMRYLVETHPAQNLELIDGVKICQPYDDSWLLVLPDASEPLVHLYANSNDRDWVDETLRNYRTRVQTFVERQQEQQPAEV
ncbi:mannose-1-phosphate guanyltransferase [Umezakia ovalisporum]|jgi:mannose-1-phosphate guanylyltransferase/phosphomannomutase|uniref:Mannose-1-phosphate guanyltransferase n=2 Tax=Umezakia ovalisporum TaxID=75695 RepID=A0AA43GVM1_9CYAN|nr:mannose-1-phosphate guanyltransferase [Umezakia ovalisporum]MBI1241328.1 NTP transferase domain-containing protein [Nostoc sp. RI_552]MDH6055299.1 mannose-1-phosphate guanyltransferase [Umezakia ovalisporum FSS-43]MDH6062603.1 mannose-1-phosphate guanyltransferase [Umezakia ovalisporum FSS-62]MDH6071234.1 mannose-1-phosphate guanyltransferase [Umezakia ovalisporum CobakiLakeA]MDH6073762.1 mannose-1-phosphate guanyltransferase [Umezakia ovalisporum CS-1034]